MFRLVRIDVRKSEAAARATALAMQTKGFTTTVEQATLAVWNWSPEATEDLGPTAAMAPDVVASDSDNEVWLVTSRSP